jgi:hypothetical protein
MAAAQPVALGPGDLPTAEECSDKINELLVEMDHQLHAAEVRRRATLIMAEELKWRPQTQTGVEVRNEPRPNTKKYMRYPPTLGVAYVSIRPLLESRGVECRIEWDWEEASMNREATGLDAVRSFRNLIPETQRVGAWMPHKCRVPKHNLQAALTLYKHLRGNLNAAVARAEMCRYVIQFVRAREGAMQFPLLQKVVPAMLPDPTARVAKPSLLRREAQGQYAAFVKESFAAHGIPDDVPLPEVGVARGP